MPHHASVINHFSSSCAAVQHSKLVKSEQLPPELDAWAKIFAQFYGINDFIQTLLHAHLDLLEWEYRSGKISLNSYRLESVAFKPLEQEATLAIESDDVDSKKAVLCHLYDYQNSRKSRLFNRLLQGNYCTNHFRNYINLLNKCLSYGWITDSMTLTILTHTPASGRSLLHELLLRGTEEDHKQDLMCYINTIDQLRGSTILIHQDYLALFMVENKHGFSVMHQAINAPHLDVARIFMTWFKENAYFSPEDRSRLVHYKSQTSKNPLPGALRPPRRVQGKLGGFEINSQMNLWRHRCKNSLVNGLLSLPSPVQAPLTQPEKRASTFFPTIKSVEENTPKSWIESWVPSASY